MGSSGIICVLVIMLSCCVMLLFYYFSCVNRGGGGGGVGKALTHDHDTLGFTPWSMVKKLTMTMTPSICPWSMVKIDQF